VNGNGGDGEETTRHVFRIGSYAAPAGPVTATPLVTTSS
jgi:hypothetical protein